ncbi:hypothetical protein N9544_01225 [Flavobacteriales bacterium]|nr:hypothetical protein [Flavobacteriales bacterium]
MKKITIITFIGLALITTNCNSQVITDTTVKKEKCRLRIKKIPL